MDTDKKSNGALIGLVIIVIILVVGGIYMWQKNGQDAGVDTSNLGENTQAQTEPLSSQDANSLNSLDTEVQSTDTNVGVDVNSVN